MSVAEFRRWIAYDKISPIGDERFDLNVASIVHIIATGFSGFAKNPKKVQFKDCVLRWDERSEEDKRTFAAKMRHHLFGVTKALGGKVIREGKNGQNNRSPERDAVA